MSGVPVDEIFSQLKDILNAENNIIFIDNLLQGLIISMQFSENRNKLNQSHWDDISELTRMGSKLLTKNDYTDEELDFVTNLLRFLRNSCGGSVANQSAVLRTTNVLELAKRPLYSFVQKDSLREKTILKICIQLFGNILLCNEGSKPFVWKLFFGDGSTSSAEPNIFKSLLSHKDQMVQEYAMMVLYNCLSDENLKAIVSTQDGNDVVVAVTSTLLKNSSDWGMLFVEHLLKTDEFFHCCYDKLPLENRLLMLDIIIEHLKCAEHEENIPIPIASIDYVKNIFLCYVKGIAELCNINSQMEPSEIMKLLSVLCSASVCNVYIPYMQSCKDLLEKCIETLKCVHLLGKQSSNNFSSVSFSTSSVSQFDKQIACHPLFGFKKDLIRLIGNLCYSCKDNQDLARKLDGIPLVLDCCKLDAKNPYIMQWCILAIRNILEKNQENQAVLAGITTTGEIVNPSLLKDMGIQICFKDGKLSVN